MTRPALVAGGALTADVDGLLDRAMEEKVATEGVRDELAALVAREPTLHSVTVTRGGEVVFEHYAKGWAADDFHFLNSCTKTVVSALVGIAVADGLLDVLQPLGDLLADVPSDKVQIRLHHLLTMTSGIDWPQYGADNISDRMCATEDWVGFILDQPVAAPPGQVTNYSNGDSHLVAAIVTRALGRPLADFATERLFAPLGITNFRWDSDPAGISRGPAGLHLRPLDMAKIGTLYLQRGATRGRQVVSSEWVEQSWTPHTRMPTIGGAAGYGYYWWIYPRADLYEAWGGAGQRVAVLPAIDTVVVATANNPDDFPRHPGSRSIYDLLREPPND